MRRALLWLIALSVGLVGAAYGGLALFRAAEAVDANPPAAARTSQSVAARGRILYVAGGQIWEWADGATRPLTRPGVRYEGPAWSPNGQQIAVSEVGENHSELLVLDANGQRLRQLTRNWSHVSVRDSAWARRPAWNPDGDRVLFVSDLGRTDMSLWSIGAQGAAARQIYSLGIGSGGLDWPTMSPDGRRIAFAAYPPGPYEPPQIYVYTVATGAVAQITQVKGGAFDPAWSPDGTRLAIAGRIDGNTRIMLVNPDGTGLLRLTDGRWERAPAWSPDGQEIAYLAADTGAFDLMAIRLVGSQVSAPRELTRDKNVDAVSGVSWAG